MQLNAITAFPFHSTVCLSVIFVFSPNGLHNISFSLSELFFLSLFNELYIYSLPQYSLSFVYFSFTNLVSLPLNLAYSLSSRFLFLYHPCFSSCLCSGLLITFLHISVLNCFVVTPYLSLLLILCSPFSCSPAVLSSSFFFSSSLLFSNSSLILILISSLPWSAAVLHFLILLFSFS